MDAVLEAVNVSKRYRLWRTGPVTLKEWALARMGNRAVAPPEHWALRDVSFTLERGRTLGVIGHNGAGKSTLLRLLSGLGRPTRGTIRRRGQLHGLLELGSGFHPDLTGLENVVTGGVLSGFTTREIRARMDAIVAFAELDDFIDQPVRVYSSGMYVRLAFATAMHFDPEVLVVDEVLAVGDERFQRKCMQRLRAFRADGGTLLLASHAGDQIRALCDEVLLLDEGRMVLKADPEHALLRYEQIMAERTSRRIESLGLQSAVPPVATGSREGTQEASIVGLRLLDSEGRETEDVSSGSDVYVELEYRLHAPVADMALILAIWQGDATKCVETVVPSVVSAFDRLPDRGVVRCRLPELRLAAGSYFLNAGLYPTDWGFTYDFQWQMHAFAIAAKPSAGENVSGILAVSPEWQLADAG